MTTPAQSTVTPQEPRLKKMHRLRLYFNGDDRPEVHLWTPGDEMLDFASMTDEEVATYLHGQRANSAPGAPW